MADLFRKRYRIKSARCPNWDYGSIGEYFITICTRNRINYFGTIKNKTMILSEAGNIAEKYWFELPAHFSNIALGAFVVMPNHIHGIVFIINQSHNTNHHLNFNLQQESEFDKESDQTSFPCPRFMSIISPNAGSIGVIIRSYKSACSYSINKTLPELKFKWQPRFHDHIVRDELALARIQNYIVNNPAHWNDDGFHREN